MSMALAVKDAAPAEESKDHFAVRNGVRCAGVHVLVDLYGTNPIRLRDIDHVERTIRTCVEEAGATLLHLDLHHFDGGGVTGVAVLAESHISIHTWPEADFAAIDIFMCGNAKPEACIPILENAFNAKRVKVDTKLRGKDM